MALSFQDASNSITAWMQAIVPALSPTAPVNATLAGAFGSVAAEVYAYLTTNANNLFLSTTTGTALTAKAADLGVQRGAGTKATASLSLTLTGLQPSGWQITTAFQFSTQGDALNPPVIFTPTVPVNTSPGQTTATVAVQATVVGTLGNVAIGTITALVGGSPYVLTITNSGAATGGTNATSDSQLLLEAQAVLAPPGSVAQMQKAAAGVTNITAAYVHDQQDGAGTIAIYALDSSNTLTGGNGTTLEPITYPLTLECLAVYNAVLAVAAPGLTLEVAQLTVTSQNVTTASGGLVQVPGSGLNATLIQNSITAYLNAFIPGQTYYPAQLIQYLMTTAFPNQLLDVYFTSMAPVTVTANGIIRAGTVTITNGP